MMPSRSRLLLAVVSAGLLAASLAPRASQATTLLQDSFSYPNGNLNGQGGWSAHSAPGVKAIQINNGLAYVVQSTGSGEDDNRPFTTRAATDSTFASFTLRIAPGTTIGSAQDYFAHFRPAAPDTNGFVTRIWIGPPTAGGDFDLGIAAGALVTTPTIRWGSGLTIGVPYRIVVSYDAITGTSKLWVNPSSSEDSPIVSTSATVVGKPLASIALRQSTPAGATITEIVDNVGVATTFNDAVFAVALPALSTWGMGLLAALLACGGLFYVSRRRVGTA